MNSAEYTECIFSEHWKGILCTNHLVAVKLLLSTLLRSLMCKKKKKKKKTFRGIKEGSCGVKRPKSKPG